MRIVFVGAGAVGGYFGGRMAEAGLEVSFLLRPASAGQLRKRGLRIASPAGDFDWPSPAVIETGTAGAAPDVLFFACKAEHVRQAAESARALVGSETVVVPLQNGVDAPSTLCDVLDPDRVVGGLSRIFAERAAPGRIHHTGLATPSITCGERGGGASERVGRIVRHLADVPGMAIDESPDIWSEMWKKLVMVCSLGAVGAVARAPLGTLLGVPETRALLESCANEIAGVARAAGASVDGSFATEQIARYENLPPETTASMHRDLERGDASELNEQLGAACRYGRRAGVATPVLDTLRGALAPGELRARGRLDYRNIGPRLESEPVTP